MSASGRFPQTVPKPLGAVSFRLWPPLFEGCGPSPTLPISPYQKTSPDHVSARVETYPFVIPMRMRCGFLQELKNG